MNRFEVVSRFAPAGDQPQAIDALCAGLHAERRMQTLLGVTGSGKTFTMAHTIARMGRPTLIISHNKTLAGQLYEEFRELLPRNAVSYFVSYYDYYQPEAYIPARDIYIEKDSSRNDDLDRLRLAATSNLVSRNDCVIIASVSCIFGLGSPDEYRASVIPINLGHEMDRDELLKQLVNLQYNRSDIDFKRATFRARGDVIEIWPSYEEVAYRIQMFGDCFEKIELINPLTGQTVREQESLFVYPAVHYVIPQERMQSALAAIREELDHRLLQLRSEGKLLEAQRLAARTKYDLEMLAEVGYCSGVENYSRHFTGAAPGSRPTTLIDYFLGRRWLLIIDESHATIPQIRAMYAGDRARKQVLVDHGFRLPSALDNRPLRFEEFEGLIDQAVLVSATPGEWELQQSGGEVVEQIIRPTGLLDPVIYVEPARGQVPHLLKLVQDRVQRGERALITCLTKRLAEDLSSYIEQAGIKCCYLHSEIDTLERMVILNDLRTGIFDAVVGVNLLREGLDLPEVSLVAILDADKEGYLRSETSLIQTIGRAARNVHAEVYMYADKITPSMQRAIDETARRRAIQEAYNTQHGITPQTVQKSIRDDLVNQMSGRQKAAEAIHAATSELDLAEQIRELQEEMIAAAEALEFERAAQLRDYVGDLRKRLSEKPGSPAPPLPHTRPPGPFDPKRTGRGGKVRGAKTQDRPADRSRADTAGANTGADPGGPADGSATPNPRNNTPIKPASKRIPKPKWM